MNIRKRWLAAVVVGSGLVSAACGGTPAGSAAGGGGSTPTGSAVGSGGSNTTGSVASTGAHGGAVTGTGVSAATGTGASSATTTSSGGQGGADAGPIGDGGPDGCVSGGGAGVCYAMACGGQVHSLQANRDRLVADLAKRKCATSCTLWAALNQAERYIFLMDTAYLGASSSRLYPPGDNNLETALDHAVALYSINGPKAGQGVDGSGRGGLDYNRIYLGFDALAECVLRTFPIANPAQTPMYNQWVKSDDVAGAHAPFTQREMIFWYKAWYDLNSNGPQWHHWAKDADFNQSGLDQRLGVCGVTDRSLTELTVAFDFYHNSDPLGNYAGMGGFGWQIVDQHVDIMADWSYMPAGCPVTAPVNMDPYGGGTFAGMGASVVNGVCTPAPLGNVGCP